MTTTAFLSLFGRIAAPFLVPAKTASAAARSRGRGRPLGRRAQRAFLDGGKHGGTLLTAGTSARTSRAKRAAVSVFMPILSLAIAEPAEARASPKGAIDQQTAAIIQEASARFGLPGEWLSALVAVESGGNRMAVSPKGAMGLTQLMPGTWTQMRRELGLGSDAFDSRNNVLAGASYLRQLHDRFGPTGGFAAYNAGPVRYAEYLSGAKSLPAETQDYVARIQRRLGWRAAPSSTAATQIVDWRTAPLFVEGRADREGGRQ